MVASILPVYENQLGLSGDRFPYKTLFSPSLRLLFKNVIFSFIPPFFSRFNKVALDLIGPSIAILLMSAILNVTYYYKPNKGLKRELISPTQFMIAYSLLLPAMSYILCKLIGKSRMLLYEIVSLLGYYLYSHILTLIVAAVFCTGAGRDFFYVLMLCTNMSTFRVVMILSRSMRIPAMRFIVTTAIVIGQMLGLIYQFFVFVHPHFAVGNK